MNLLDFYLNETCVKGLTKGFENFEKETMNLKMEKEDAITVSGEDKKFLVKFYVFNYKSRVFRELGKGGLKFSPSLLVQEKGKQKNINLVVSINLVTPEDAALNIVNESSAVFFQFNVNLENIKENWSKTLLRDIENKAEAQDFWLNTKLENLAPVKIADSDKSARPRDLL